MISMIDELIQGLEILKKYDPNLQFMHEYGSEYLAVGTRSEVSDEDIKRLIKLGWMYNLSFDNWIFRNKRLIRSNVFVR